ncbi:MAG: hypothetical protein L0Y58_03170 [Verrucomicrobia subdivision 3 bacterium]|nr:hypothetical protein [Limisphaerales bacterium]
MKTFCTSAALAIALCTLPLQAQDHGHLRIGAASTNQGAALYFFNGADFATNSLYVKTLIFTNAGRYAGYYQGNITLTVQAATPDYAGPEPDAPALGSYIRARILSVTGPAAGAFAFWETGATTPTISVATGQTGTNSFNVTQTDGFPGADPFGHVHGRRLAVTKSGIYAVTLQAFDTSTNGLIGGPIHTPSEPITVYFQGGVNIQSIEPDTSSDVIRVRFGALAGFNWSVQYTPDLTNTWQSTHPVMGNDAFIESMHQTPLGQRNYYRLLGTPIEP